MMAAGRTEISTAIHEMANQYTIFTREAIERSRKMVMQALTSLKCHRESLDRFEDGDYKVSLQMLERVTECAKVMETESGNLEEMTRKLEEEAYKASVDSWKLVTSQEKVRLTKEAETKKLELERDKKKAEQEGQKRLAESRKESAEAARRRVAALDAEVQKTREDLEKKESEFERELENSMKDLDEKKKQNIREAEDNVQQKRCELLNAQHELNSQKNTTAAGNFFRGVKHVVGYGSDHHVLVADAENRVGCAQAELDRVLKVLDTTIANCGHVHSVEQAEKKKRLQERRQEYKRLNEAHRVAKDKEIETARELQQELEKEGRAVSDEFIKANTEIQKMLAMIDSSSEEHSSIENAIQSLEVCKQTLSKVAVSFGQSKKFWNMIQLQTEAMRTDQSFLDLSAQFVRTGTNGDENKDRIKKQLEKLRHSMVKSAQGWGAMGHMIYEANQLLVPVESKQMELMRDLPTGSESLKDIKKLARDLVLEVKNQTMELENKAQEES